jgi:asparagine synthase (glutamine-hydrolysing)
MCGLAGFISAEGVYSDQEMSHISKNMGDKIHHRGPDNQGIWHSRKMHVGLSHQRLSILDLSNAGSQPMTSQSGRFVIAFNGEIYNHLNLRKKIFEKCASYTWIGHSDTETILGMFEIFGIQESLRQFTGMFSIAVLDKQRKILSLSRDRSGEKPLYYGFQGKGSNKNFIFGSELKALCAHPSFENKLDHEALQLFFKKSFIPAPFSIYKNIKKLVPGSILTISLEELNEHEEYFWDPSNLSSRSHKDSYDGDIYDSLDDFERILSNSVKEQMIADVPLGAFLSGGIDSSLITCLMQTHSTNPVNTFTIGFKEDNFNEAKYAQAVANQLGTNHTELYVSPVEAMSVIPKLPDIFCEPFADQAQIPNFLISELASQSVKVCLSGDGGDELFSGYSRYFAAQNSWNKLNKIPLQLKPSINLLLASITKLDLIKSNDRIKYFQRAFESKNLVDFYDLFITQNVKYDQMIIKEIQQTFENDFFNQIGHLQPLEQMMFIDYVQYLPDAILAKVDRTSMAVSLETRAPFLDRNLVEFAWSLPIKYKYYNKVPKWHLKRILAKFVTNDIIDRPKQGFSVPLNYWIRGPLRSWAENLLNFEEIKSNNILNSELISHKWEEHLSGKRDNISFLWPVLMFLAWSEGKTFN